MDEIKDIAYRAGLILLAYQNRQLHINTKMDDTDFVTQADKEADAFIRCEIGNLFPKDQILSEESDTVVQDFRGRVWIVDPLDATSDYIQRGSEYSIMIGLAVDGKAVLGVIYLPVLDIYYFSQKSKGAWKQVRQEPPIRLHVNAVEASDTIRIIVSEDLPSLKGEFTYIHAASGGLKAGLVAEGVAEGILYIDNNTGKWDFCASDILIHEAGGRMTTMNDVPIDYSLHETAFPKQIIASNNATHSLLLTVLEN